MTWEQAVLLARSSNDLSQLIEDAYLSEDLKSNVERYRTSLEYQEIQKYLFQYFGSDKKISILDIGAGNGITSINFALDGYDVLALEPDESNHVGSGAIEFLKNCYGLDSLEVVVAFAEDLEVDRQVFDVVFVRQAMHHANDLTSFVKNTSRFLRKGGVYFTVRDHVIFNRRDKELFLKQHHLHKFYGGENAFRPFEYRSALEYAGLNIEHEIKYLDSIINLAPFTLESLEQNANKELEGLKERLIQKLGLMGRFSFVLWLYRVLKYDPTKWRSEERYPGRMYSYIAIKP
jgi:2-polyprenyl-3-methyl-5-hydroxy-6-metoxy-1,4-benzoquinol methylase